MKTATVELLTHLNNFREFILADLYTIVLRDGTQLRYTSFDKALNYQFFAFTPAIFERGRTRVVKGFEVDTLDLTIYPTTEVVNAVPMLKAFYGGQFDGASVKLERVFLNEGAAVIGGIVLFIGRMTDMVINRTSIKVQVRSWLEVLNTKMPRNLFHPPCMHNLYDNGCGVLKMLYEVQTVVQVGSNQRTILTNTAAPTFDYYNLGTMLFLNGQNVGLFRTIKFTHAVSPAIFEVANPLPFLPETGAIISIWPGCDKTEFTCQNKFNNLPNFRGFPFVPEPESAI